MVSGPKKSHISEEFDLIIVGYGIAARCLLQEMAKDAKFHNKNILVLHHEDFFKPCSLNTTSVVCLSDIQKGISPLGDMIVDSFELASSYYRGLASDVVECAKQFSLKKDEKENIIKKEYEAFFIHPEKLLLEMEGDYKNLLKLTFLKQFVSDLVEDNASTLVTTNEGDFRTRDVVVAAGAWSNFLQKDIQNDDLNRSKFVSGSYLIFEDVDYGQESFSYSYGHFNIIYKSYSQELLIGGTTVKENIEAPSVTELLEQYTTFQTLLDGEILLPPFECAKIKTGIRHKGRKRMPYFGEVRKGLYLMSGLYKNGFSFPFLGAKKITSLMSERL